MKNSINEKLRNQCFNSIKENEKKISVYNVGFILLLVASVMSNAFSTIYIGPFAYIAAYTYHIVIPILFFIALVDSLKDGVNIKKALLIFLMIVIIFLAILNSGSSYDKRSAFVSTFCFFEMLFIIFIMSRIKLSRKLINAIFIANVIIALIYIVQSNFDFAFFYIGSGRIISFGFNSNFAGMLLMINSAILLIAFFFYKNRTIKAVLILLFIYTVYLIFMTDSRTSIFTIGILIFLSVLKKKVKITKPIIVLVTLLPVIFPFIYLKMASIPYFQSINLFEKGFISGRDIMYNSFFNNISEWIWLGNFSFIFSNAHNGPLAIALTIGVFGFVIYYLYLWSVLFSILKTISKSKAKTKSKASTIAFISILTLFVHACAEAAFFTSGQHIAVSTGILYLLAKVDMKNI